MVSSIIDTEDKCCISSNLKNLEQLPRIQLYGSLTETESLRTNLPNHRRHRSSMQTDLIFEAFPSSVRFTDYEIGVKYEVRNYIIIS